MTTRHEGCRDCSACLRMQEMYGTCEYIGETHRCECAIARSRERLLEKPEPKQTVLKSESTTRTRIAYWMNYMREQRELIRREDEKKKNR